MINPFWTQFVGLTIKKDPSVPERNCLRGIIKPFIDQMFKTNAFHFFIYHVI